MSGWYYLTQNNRTYQIISPTGRTLRALHYTVQPIVPIRKFNASATNRIPDISGSIPYQQYGSYVKQYERLNEAIKLDRTAALESASWGMFQIMGNRCKNL